MEVLIIKTIYNPIRALFNIPSLINESSSGIEYLIDVYAKNFECFDQFRSSNEKVGLFNKLYDS